MQPEDTYIHAEEISVPEAASDPVKEEPVELLEKPSEEEKSVWSG